MAVVEMVAVLSISLLALYLLKRFILTDADNLMAGMVFFAPILLYGVISGKISEFSGFGILAKTEVLVRTPIVNFSTKIDSIKILSPKETIFQRAAFFEACEKYFIVRPSLVPSDEQELKYYVANATYAIRSSIACGAFIGLVVLDDENQYIGSFSKSFFTEAMAAWAIPNGPNPISAGEFTERVLSMTVFGASLHYPADSIGPGEGVEAAININSTLDEAFNKFRSANIGYLVLTDEMGRFKGVVQYERVVDEILGLLLAASRND